MNKLLTKETYSFSNKVFCNTYKKNETEVLFIEG